MSTIKTWQQRIASDYPHPTDRPEKEYMQAEIDELRAENSKLRAAAIAVIDRWDTPLKAVEALVADAARYRWLREQARLGTFGGVVTDAAIDAAMKGETP